MAASAAALGGIARLPLPTRTSTSSSSPPSLLLPPRPSIHLLNRSSFSHRLQGREFKGKNFPKPILQLPTGKVGEVLLLSSDSYHIIPTNAASESPSCLLLKEFPRFSCHRIRASSSEDSGSVQVDELFSDLKEKWDGLENKSTVFIYGGGAIVAIWLSSIVVGAVNSVPLLPKIMELVGLGYTGWFVYRYLLFKSSRKELATDIEELKKKIAGTGE